MANFIPPVNGAIVFVFNTRKRAPKNNQTNCKVKIPLCEQRNMFGARIKIMWQEELVDALIHFIL